MDTQIDILNRVEKASKGSMAIVWTKPLASVGRNSAMGISRNWPMVGVAM